MFNTLKKRIKNEKGLSLVELLAVIVILAIVAAIAIPAIGNIIENSRIKALKADAATIINAANIYYTDGKTDFDLDKDADGKLSGSGVDYVTLSSTVSSKITVTKAGELSGSLSKSGTELKFDAASLSDINIESPEEVDGKVEIVKAEDEE